ncbi:hypothetical protein V1517DRAFT_333340, partial [Lipomyces orientalis]
MMDSPSECVIWVQGDNGDVIIPIHTSRPEKIIINVRGEKSKTLNFPIPGEGLFWEAEAVARYIRDGKKGNARPGIPSKTRFCRCRSWTKFAGRM